MSAPAWLSTRFDSNIAYVAASDLVEFLGVAEPGANKAEGKWAIFKVLYSGTNITEIRWANGDRRFDKVWDDRAIYMYDTT